LSIIDPGLEVILTEIEIGFQAKGGHIVREVGPTSPFIRHMVDGGSLRRRGD